MSKKSNVYQTNDLRNPSQEGDHHRLLVMTGANKGTVFYIVGKRAVLGRDIHCDIVINDQKISREHAEFVLLNGKCVVTDLNTQNGIIVNDSREKQATLNDGNKIVIGQTVIKYNFIKVSSTQLVPANSLAPNKALAKIGDQKKL